MPHSQCMREREKERERERDREREREKGRKKEDPLTRVSQCARVTFAPIYKRRARQPVSKMLSRHNGTHTLHFPFPLSIFLLLTARVIYGEISISGLFLSWLFPFTCTRHHFFRPFSTHFPTYPFVESVAFPLSFAPLLDTGKLRSHPSLLSYFERNSSAFELRRKYTAVFLNIARMSPSVAGCRVYFVNRIMLCGSWPCERFPLCTIVFLSSLKHTNCLSE